MFGHLTPKQPEMKIKEFEAYRSVYCGLCHELFAHHGMHTAALLNYDMAFLILLLDGLYEAQTKEREARCAVHPIQRHKERCSVHTAYAADMLILLSYHKLMDDWTDEKQMTHLGAAKTLERAYKKAKLRYPRQAQAIEEQILRLSQLERAGEENLDAVSACTGAMLAEIFVYKEDEWSATLREMGMSLGQAIYLMDAYEDVEKDIKKGSYNPLKRFFEDGQLQEVGVTMMEGSMAQATQAFERLPILEGTQTLRNILYAGVWTRVYAAQARRQSENEKKNGENE